MGLELSGRVSPCVTSIARPCVTHGGARLVQYRSRRLPPGLSILLPATSPVGRGGAGGGARGQAAARGMSGRGKMSPPETIKRLNKILRLSECSLFFSVCLGSATLTSWPYRGAAEWTGLIAQETGALASCSALAKPGQEFHVFALQKKFFPVLSPFPFCNPQPSPPDQAGHPSHASCSKSEMQINSPSVMLFLVHGLCVPSCPGELM